MTQFEYRDVMYDRLADAEDAVANYIGQNMNNIDPKSTEKFADECMDYIFIYVDGEYKSSLNDFFGIKRWYNKRSATQKMK